jgi:ABC-type lipoprotein release transport system permease subunit
VTHHTLLMLTVAHYRHKKQGMAFFILLLACTVLAVLVRAGFLPSRRASRISLMG